MDVRGARMAKVLFQDTDTLRQYLKAAKGPSWAL